MLERLAPRPLNRLLRANAWALDKLRPHAGKTARLACPPVDVALTVLETGEIAAAPPGVTPSVTITVTPGVLLRMAARDAAAWKDAQVSGDTEFAAAIDYVRRNLEWDYEEDLSRVFGDIAAHRLAGAVRALDDWGRAAALNVGHALAEYATHEQPVLAAARAVDAFNRAVDDVRDHVERLEKRIELLRRRLER